MCDSLRRATETLRKVDVDPKHKKHVYVKAYANGREQGYLVRVNAPPGNLDCLNLWFAEARCGDQMVLYIGSGYQDELTEDAWKSGEYFDSVDDLVVGVSDRINDYIKRQYHG
jgi:hypothetical protein